MSRFLQSLVSKFHRRRTIACGLLGPTNLDDNDNLWMAKDFVVLRELIGTDKEKSLWLSGTPLPQDEIYLVGDPACDRIVFPPPTFVTCETSPRALRTRFIREVVLTVAKMTKKDTLVLVLVGHGNVDKLVLGNPDVEGDFVLLHKDEIEVALRGSKGTVWLISTTCESGSWGSPHWSLLAGAEIGQESVSTIASGSEKHRGGFFTNALLAEHAHEFHMNAPCPGPLDSQGIRQEQLPHDFGVDSIRHPTSPSLKPTLQAVLDWIHTWRNNIGCTYTSANVCFRPRLQSQFQEPHTIPFRSLDSQTAAFHRFQCVPPSPPTSPVIPPNTVNTQPRTANSMSMASPLAQSRLQAAPRPLSSDPTLLNLAQEFLDSMPVSTPRNAGLIIKCLVLVHGTRTVTEIEQSRLLSELKDRKSRQDAAMAIASNLGWVIGVTSVGKSHVWNRNYDFELQKKAEAAGCLVTVVFGPGHPCKQYLGAAGWLALVWQAEGCPTIPLASWTSAVTQAMDDSKI